MKRSGMASCALVFLFWLSCAVIAVCWLWLGG